MEKKIIWHLNENRWNSAITEYALSCAAALEKAGLTNIFFARSSSSADVRAKQLGIKTVGLKIWFDLFFIYFFTFKKSSRPYAVFCYNGKDAFSALLLKLFFGTKVFRFKGDQRNSTSYLNFFDRIIVPSLTMKNLLLKTELKTSLICDVTLGLEEASFSYEPSVHQDPFFLIFGRFDPIKGHNFFIHVYKEFRILLEKKDPTLPVPKLRICGKEANLTVADLEASVKLFGLVPGEDVEIEDRFISNKKELLSSASIGIISSLGSEWICRVSEEFLMCGTPVFISEAGSLKDMLIDPDFAQSYDHLKDSPVTAANKLLAYYLKTLQLKPEERSRFSNNAKIIFGLDTMVERLKATLF